MSVARLESRPIGVASALSAALALVALVALLALAQPARADIGETIILRCTHGQSLSGFSQSDYRKALKELSADTEEYSPCAAEIRKAQLAAASGGGGGGSAGAGAGAGTPVPIAPTASEQQAITHAQNAGSEPVRLDGRVIDPGVVHANIASALSTLPTPLLATLAFILACLLLVGAGVLRNRVRARRSD